MGILDSIFGAEERIESTAIDTNSSLCQDCKNEGVAILPVVGRKMLSTNQQTNQKYMLQDQAGTNNQRQKITQGFIYVYYKQKSLWEGYQVDNNSCIRRINLDSLPNLEARDFGCNVSGHNDKLKFITLNPKYGSDVWIAYSIYPWTEKVRNRLAKEGYKTDTIKKSADEMRADRMMRLNLTQTQVSFSGSSQEYNVIGLGKSQQMVISTKGLNPFIENLKIELDNYHIKQLESLNPESGANKVDQSVFEQMQQTNQEAKPYLLVFEDPVGDLNILNNQRNYCINATESIRNADIQGKKPIGNPNQAEFEYKLVMAKSIKGIISDAGILSAKYERRLKLAEFKAYESILSDIEILQRNYLVFDAVMVERMQDYSSIWKFIQAYDFDHESIESIIYHRDMVLSSFLGAGSAEFYRACGMGNNSTNTDIQVGDWIINTLCNLQPDLISLIKQQEQKSVNTDRLYDSLKGDIQASFTVLSEYIGNNESKYGKLFGQLSGNKLSQDTATAVSALLSNSYQTILGDQRKRGQGDIPKAQVRSITIAMQNFLLSNHREIAIPMTLQGKARSFYENLIHFSKEDSTTKYTNFTDTISGDSFGQKSVSVHDLRGRSGAVAKTESFHIFTLMVSVQLKNGQLPNAQTLKEMDQLTNRPILKLVNDKVLKDAIDNLNSRVNTMSSTAGIVLSGSLMLFQSRAMISNLEKMGTDKSLLENAELGAAAMGATMMVMSASIELSANITQLSAVTKELKMKAASRSLLAATVGLYAGVAELGYLYFYSRNNNSVPQHYLFSNGLAVFAFSVAGRALAEVMAKQTGSSLAVKIVFSQVGGIALFSNPYFLAAVMVIGLATSLWSYYKMAVYDDSASNLSVIDYWLDFGVFGNRELFKQKDNTENPFKTTSSFTSANSEISALALLMKEQDVSIKVLQSGSLTKSFIDVDIKSYLPLSSKDYLDFEITKNFRSTTDHTYLDYVMSDGDMTDVEFTREPPETITWQLSINDLLKSKSSNVDRLSFEERMANMTRSDRTLGDIANEKFAKPTEFSYQEVNGGYLLKLKFESTDHRKISKLNCTLVSKTHVLEFVYTATIPASGVLIDTYKY